MRLRALALAAGLCALPAPAQAAGLPFPVHPVTRFEVLTDYDAIQNYVPGDEYDGPVHLNRGPLGEGAVLAARFAGANGRTRMRIRNAASGPFKAQHGQALPTFFGRVSLTYVPRVDGTPDPANRDGFFTVEGGVPDLAKVFRSPENATSFGGRPGPLLVTEPVPLPKPLAPSIAGAVGLPPGTPALADGLYVPTAGLAGGYRNGDALAGGIYVRGTVLRLRGAVDGPLSYYAFQVGYPRAQARIYVARVDRARGGLALVALPTDEPFPAGDLAAVFTRPARAASDLASWGVGGRDTLARGFGGSFNGVIAVDRSAHDTGPRPLTGHVLALGDPTPWAKQPLGGAANALPPELLAADVFSTATPAGTATGLTIWAAGTIFIQNHLIVDGLATAPTLDGYLAGLARPKGQDRLAVWADNQVMVGLAAPGDAAYRLEAPGTVVTASLLALGDPGRTFAREHHLPYPRTDEGSLAYFGSIGTEGVMPFYNAEEDYHIGVGPGGARPYLRLLSTGFPYPENPIYEGLGQGELADFRYNPNGARARGQFVVFGSMIQARRGIIGKGDTSFTRRLIFDPRLAELLPPLVP